MEEIVTNTANTAETSPQTEVTENVAEVSNNVNAELENLKRLLSKANTEAASYKRQLRERMSADEKANAEAHDQLQSLKDELAELKKEKAIQSYTNEYMALGFDKEMATNTAIAKLSGDDITVFTNLKSLTESINKNAIAKAMDNQKGLTVGNPPQAQRVFSREEIRNMSEVEINANWDAIKASLKK